jgi:hypothetical protein
MYDYTVYNFPYLYTNNNFVYLSYHIIYCIIKPKIRHIPRTYIYMWFVRTYTGTVTNGIIPIVHARTEIFVLKMYMEPLTLKFCRNQICPTRYTGTVTLGRHPHAEI